MAGADATGPGDRRSTDTLERLERRRQEVETGFLEGLAAIDGKIDELASVADEVLEASREASRRERDDLERLEGRLEELARRLDGAARTVPWPGAGGGAGRRRLNALVRWALRDWLEVLDRRQDGLREGLDGARELVGEIRGLVGLLRRRAAAGAAGQAHEGGAAAHGVGRRAVEVLAALAEIHERTRLLVDAKDAEGFERATAGPILRTDVLLDEMARQQEALLAELYRRRGGRADGHGGGAEDDRDGGS